jgi:hypothetical protein
MIQRGNHEVSLSVEQAAQPQGNTRHGMSRFLGGLAAARMRLMRSIV